eukprot:CAMPEP_0194222090 /NCGR_PEP_ID=MMETSP0156-20130528/32107_1 /TAXON_ID=33649 /ORGANISM="Thalassionema nitzschioides, Strain L26-B" /LENGTH=1069 /DNA_ID=CAMNT_0038952733 /DNA_START=10 /DNA_END=3216 /DNA_ORIENTATION=-
MMSQTPTDKRLPARTGSNGSSRGSSFGSVTTYHGPKNTSKSHPLLTVFQAAPLVYFQDADVHPVPILDFESERRHLTESLTDGSIKIDLCFDIATTERLGNFFNRGKGQALHFSCHGHHSYLAIEDGWGAMHALPVEKLKDWISAGGDNLLFVFVSACHSRSAGEAFLEAGVKHVVCCEQDDQPIQNLVSVQFARAFYEALANGKLLSEAFELARQLVMNRPCLDPIQLQKEVEKLALLPEGVDHNIRIFEASEGRRTPQKIINHQSSSTSAISDGGSDCLSTSRNRILPVPPQVLEGRQVDIFNVLDALKLARVVRVSGSEAGIGKLCVVQSVIQYIQERRNIFSLEFSEIIWLPSQQQEEEGTFSKVLEGVCSIFQSTPDEGHERSCQKFVRSLHQGDKKFLLVIDARQAQCPDASRKVACFVKDVIQSTRTKVIIIHSSTDASMMGDLPCVERNVTLEALDFTSTVHLFGKLCQHVVNRQCRDVSNHLELSSLLIPNASLAHESSRDESWCMSSRGRHIFKMVGEGIPAKIHHVAKNMSAEEYARMIAFGRRKQPVLEFKSRTALEKELSVLALEVAKAAEEKRFLAAQEFQDQFDEMEILRERLPEFHTLINLAQSIENDQQNAVNEKKFGTAHKLQEQYDSLQEQIKIERVAMKKLGINEEDLMHSSEIDTDETRVELEAHISALEKELEAACDKNDISRARKVHPQIVAMKQRRESLPSQKELILEKKQLESFLAKAKMDRDWDLAEDLLGKLKMVKTGIDRERKAVSLFENVEDRKTRHNHGTNSQPGAFAIRQSSESETEIDSNHRRDNATLSDGESEVTEERIVQQDNVPEETTESETEIDLSNAAIVAVCPGPIRVRGIDWDETEDDDDHSGVTRGEMRCEDDEVLIEAHVVPQQPMLEEGLGSSSNIDPRRMSSEQQGQYPIPAMLLQDIRQNFPRRDHSNAEQQHEQYPIPAILLQDIRQNVPRRDRHDAAAVSWNNDTSHYSSIAQKQGGSTTAMGRTDRLVLEQMIQESISNMVVPAVKVERIMDESELYESDQCLCSATVYQNSTTETSRRKKW